SARSNSRICTRSLNAARSPETCFTLSRIMVSRIGAIPYRNGESARLEFGGRRPPIRCPLLRRVVFQLHAYGNRFLGIGNAWSERRRMEGGIVHVLLRYANPHHPDTAFSTKNAKIHLARTRRDRLPHMPILWLRPDEQSERSLSGMR